MHLLSDVRFVMKTLTSQPLLTLTVVSTLAVALAFNVASASVLTALLDRPFPYPDLGDVLLVRDAHPREGVHQGRALAAADFVDLSRSVTSFARITAWRPADLVITGSGGDPEAIEGVSATASFFTTLGVVPVAGQSWSSDADEPGHDGVALISHRLWRSRFGGDPSAIGSTMLLNGRATVITGIVRDEDAYPSGVDAWVPLVMTPDERAERRAQRLNVIARLAPFATFGRARAEVTSAAARMSALFPATNEGRSFDLLPLRREQYEFTAPLFGFVQAAALLVLAIAIVNVTTVLVARTLDRRHELSVRSMLGASRGDIGSLVLTETTILAALAAVIGVLAAIPMLNAIRASLPEGISRWVNGWSGMRVDRTSLAIGALIGLASALIMAGVAAATAVNVARAGWSSSRLTRRRTWGRRTVVAGELALAAALLLCAAVLVRGFGQVATAFDSLAPDRLLRFTLTSPPWRYPDEERVSAFHRRLEEGLAAMAGVETVGLIRNEPASNVPNPILPFQRLDAPPVSPGNQPRADIQIVSPSTFDVLRIPSVSGRRFLASDSRQSTRVAIVSREAVRRFWPDRDPIGTLVRIGAEPGPVRIVGVAGDLRLNWYDPETSPVIYLPDSQSPARTVAVLIRTRIDPRTVEPEVRAVVAQLDEAQPIAGLEPLTKSVGDSLSPIRVIEQLLLAGAALAAALAAVGVYGVLAQFVSLRRRELGVRLALGATRESIARMILVDAAWTAAIGVTTGLVLAVPAVSLARSLLLGLTSLDAVAVLVAIACTFALVLSAALVPALRAARVDVATLLRFE